MCSHSMGVGMVDKDLDFTGLVKVLKEIKLQLEQLNAVFTEEVDTLVDFHDCEHKHTETQNWTEYKDPTMSDDILVCLDCGAWYNDMEQEWQV